MSLLTAVSRLAFAQGSRLNSLALPGGSINRAATPLMQFVRTKIRCYFPRPSERKRIKKHGWEKRVSTYGGRRILMNRILKGRWVLSH